MKRSGVGVVLVLALALAGSAHGQEAGPRVRVKLREGQPVEGTLLGFEGGRFRLKVDGRERTIDEAAVDEVELLRPAPQYRPVHAAPVLTAVDALGEPGKVCVRWSGTGDSEFVVVYPEVWCRAGEGEWRRVAVPAPDAGTAVVDGLPPWVPLRFKVVTKAEVDRENPVIQRFPAELPEAERVKESASSAPIEVRAGLDVAPLSVVTSATHPGAPDSALLRLTPASGPAAVVQVVRGGGLPGGGTLVDLVGGDRPAVVVRHPLGGERRFEGSAASVRSSTPAALAKAPPRPLTIDLEGTTVGDVVDLLAFAAAPEQVVTAPAVDVTADLRVSVHVRDKPRDEVLRLLADVAGLQATRWCDVLLLEPVGAPPRWTPPPSPALDGRGVDLALRDAPLDEALGALRHQLGLDLVITPRGLDLIENEARRATVVAARLGLRQALTLLTHDAGLRWHLRDGTLIVHAVQEVPSAAVGAARLLELVAAGGLEAAHGVELEHVVPQEAPGLETRRPEFNAWRAALEAWGDRPRTVEALAKALLRVERSEGGGVRVMGEPPAPGAVEPPPAGAGRDGPARGER
jgi:hypothetical protein